MGPACKGRVPWRVTNHHGSRKCGAPQTRGFWSYLRPMGPRNRRSEGSEGAKPIWLRYTLIQLLPIPLHTYPAIRSSSYHSYRYPLIQLSLIRYAVIQLRSYPAQKVDRSFMPSPHPIERPPGCSHSSACRRPLIPCSPTLPEVRRPGPLTRLAVSSPLWERRRYGSREISER
jgi:hypothetical protein